MSSIIEVLYDLIIKRKQDIEAWLIEKGSLYFPIVNVSVDLRNSGYKIAPVDTNIFPAGYNNFSLRSQKLAATIIKKYLKENYNECSKIIIISENHTRNAKYTDNLIVLKKILEEAGFIVEVGSYDINQDMQKMSCSGKSLTIFSLVKKDNLVSTKCGFIPDLLFLNNDMTKGLPEFFQNVTSQVIIPSVKLGWFQRKKFQHFSVYHKLILEFSKRFDIDHWLISTLIDNCDNVDFSEKLGIQDIANKVNSLITSIREKFTAYSIKERPYVFIKANNGTYGMGVMVTYDSEDFLQINKKVRNKMSKVKYNQKIDSVLIQEGIPSIDVFQSSVAEPLVYCIGYNPIAFLYRHNSIRDKFANLNSLGSSFSDVSCQVSEKEIAVWGLLGRLSALSAAIELYEMQEQLSL